MALFSKGRSPAMVLALSSQQGGALLRVRAFYQCCQGSWYGAATVRISLAFAQCTSRIIHLSLVGVSYK